MITIFRKLLNVKKKNKIKCEFLNGDIRNSLRGRS
jgi:hypothetical protein